MQVDMQIVEKYRAGNMSPLCKVNGSFLPGSSTLTFWERGGALNRLQLRIPDRLLQSVMCSPIGL